MLPPALHPLSPGSLVMLPGGRTLCNTQEPSQMAKLAAFSTLAFAASFVDAAGPYFTLSASVLFVIGFGSVAVLAAEKYAS